MKSVSEIEGEWVGDKPMSKRLGNLIFSPEN